MGDALKTTVSEQRAVLTFLSGEHFDEAIKLKRDATIFGRDKGDVIVSDPEVSSTHCQIQEIEGIYHLFDMNSTNGTFLNGERVIKAKLKATDIITIGNTSFRITFEAEKNTRDIPTVFKPGLSDRSRSSSLIETLIESELKNTQFNAIKINVIYTNGERETLDLKQRMVYIGRASSFGRFDADHEISRKHLLIKLNNNGEVFIEDQASTNGAFLNGKKIRGMHQVNPQDEVRVGGAKMRIEAKLL